MNNATNNLMINQTNRQANNKNKQTINETSLQHPGALLSWAQRRDSVGHPLQHTAARHQNRCKFGSLLWVSYGLVFVHSCLQMFSAVFRLQVTAASARAGA